MTMPEYIEREATCKNCIYSPICKLYADFGLTDLPYIENDTCKMFKNKSDVVEVVRCAKCKHLKTNIDKENYCDIHSTTWAKFYVRFSDFCSFGKRKDDK